MKKSTTDKTIRLKKQEAAELKEMSFELTKKAIMLGHQKIYKESDIVHFLIDKMSKKISINKDGNLTIE
ncbi:hypothetical protein [Pasteurella multocida]|uniref:hypothetical protein n=1 Tax=Pasteurella multocida TaxID=747 RepID=UPI001F0D4AA9|nr:hypothetical protein [Pasteurella multocida]MDY0579204.1 hypothetical protein [Pasteurella multocida]MEB3458437.1 hypothetical protein [Pasteurella multocida]MEB3501297.1 hypothetical protein [Pasteurella multocida]